jgi:ubiquinone/menaquinone biosynthesis C-methylase UbiE
MGVWENHLLPRVIDVLLGTREVRRHREDVVAGLGGSVVEIGFGSGLNVPLYPAAVTGVMAVEPSSTARKLGTKRISRSPVPVEYVGLDGQRLQLDDESVDAALSTFTLCTIPDGSLALDELRRVLRPGGRIHFLEHGLAPDWDVAAKQQRFNSWQQRVAGGCNLTRPIDRLVSQAGFEMIELNNEWMRGPRTMRPWNYLYKGIAVKPI